MLLQNRRSRKAGFVNSFKASPETFLEQIFLNILFAGLGFFGSHQRSAAKSKRQPGGDDKLLIGLQQYLVILLSNTTQYLEILLRHTFKGFGQQQPPSRGASLLFLL